MVADLFEHAEQLQNEVELLDANVKYWRLNQELCVRSAALFVNIFVFWHDLGLIRRDILKTDPSVEIDCDDRVTDKFLSLQQVILNIHARFDPLKWTSIKWQYHLLRS